MKRYFEEVKKVDRKEISIPEFIEMTGGNPNYWADWQAAWWIYKEDGGTKISFEEWFKNAPKPPIPFEKERTPI